MQAPWEYFEHFSDLVYVSDIDTHELVYLNRHARELYGFPSEADYKGHPCYEVMQHAHEPCTFCTCRALLESGAAEWVYRNPVTAHTFRIKARWPSIWTEASWRPIASIRSFITKRS